MIYLQSSAAISYCFWYETSQKWQSHIKRFSSAIFLFKSVLLVSIRKTGTKTRNA